MREPSVTMVTNINETQRNPNQNQNQNQKQNRNNAFPRLTLVGIIVFLGLNLATMNGALDDYLLVAQTPAFITTSDENRENLPDSPFFGWQPETTGNDTDPRCSDLNFCTQEISDRVCPHNCLRSLDAFVNAPPRPGFLPDPNATEAENKQNAWNVEWIPDVTLLRNMLIAGKDQHGNRWPPLFDGQYCENSGNHQPLLDAIQAIRRPFSINSSKAKLAAMKMDHQPKVLCFIYTTHKAHHSRLRAIRETWAPECDGFLAFSTKDDPRIPAISIPHRGKEEYRNMVR